MGSEQRKSSDGATQDYESQVKQLTPAERIQVVLGFSGRDSGRFSELFTRELCKLKELDLSSPGTARAVFTFKVHDFYCNPSRTLHGGAQALFFDICTSTVLMGVNKDPDVWWNAGVTRTLTVNILRPAPEGMECEMECEVVHAGTNLAMLRGLIKRASDGAVLSTCEHNKAAVRQKGFSKM